MTTIDSRKLRHGLAAAAVAFAIIGLLPDRAVAGSATDQLRPAIEQVIRILDDPALKGPAQTAARRAAVRGAIEPAIDFPEAAKRALALHWRARTAAERDEFVTLFRDLVMYSYMRTIESYAGEKVAFIGEAEADGVTTVLTRIQRRRGEPIPVDYRMHRRGTRWLVYDVIVENVGLVANYRAQFNTIIQTSSYAELIRRIRARVAELSEAPAAGTRAVPHEG